MKKVHAHPNLYIHEPVTTVNQPHVQIVLTAKLHVIENSHSVHARYLLFIIQIY
jgi:hypothetical protein